MRKTSFPSTLLLMATVAAGAAPTFGQTGAPDLTTSSRTSVMSAPVETITDLGQAFPMEAAPVANAPVYSEAPAYSLQELAPEYEVYQPATAPAAAPKKDTPNPAAKAFNVLFYANDFSYLNDSYDGPRYLGDNWKNMPVGRNGRLSIGGETRYRYHSERGMGSQAGQLGFQDTENDFGLTRLRLFADYKVNDRIRLFAEGIYADVVHSNDEFIPRGIDRNYGDILNLFADVKISDNTTVRVGRQELLFGAQRLVSPLDWANTRRTFDGVRTISKYDDWNVDAFWTQPVQVVRNELDQGNSDVGFYGLYSTYKGMENANLDLYYLGLDFDQNFSVNTFGSRLYGNRGDWLYDCEGSIQTGTNSVTGADIEAYAMTAGIGRKLKNMSWNPQLWFYYDYASGDQPGTINRFEGFNQLFPLAHKYLGFIDAVARQNISAPNVQLVMNPTKKLKLLFWYHNFSAVQANQIIPGVAVPSAQQAGSEDFGNELDFIANLNINPRNSLLVGYSHLWRGDRIIGDTDADFFYLQVTRRF